eukprot:CAMPEP_0181122110 /NCGR_PEP_ID=MMETSP1071-20121207/25125_1 /TAXON_ID=35127 /ORGANISM="Thalassiosira sp., Strain NH16" /LENGTH=170 /DNA_ID=CAMNT_0023207031 /DNA_START=11 /DNA_END=523 /DNA_ORIENTATION=-
MTKVGKTVKNSSYAQGENSLGNHVGFSDDDVTSSSSTSDGSIGSMDVSARMIWELPRLNDDANSIGTPLEYSSTSSCASGSLDSNIRDYGPIDVDTCRKQETNAKKTVDTSIQISRGSGWKKFFHNRDCRIPKVVILGSKERIGKKQSNSKIAETNLLDCEQKLEAMVFV